MEAEDKPVDQLKGDRAIRAAYHLKPKTGTVTEPGGGKETKTVKCRSLTQINKATPGVSQYDVSIPLTCSFGLNQVLAEANRTPLQESSRNLTYDLLCALANPSRDDTRGLSHLAEVAERFAFSLLTQSQCAM